MVGGGKYETGYPSTADNHIPHAADAIKNWGNTKERYKEIQQKKHGNVKIGE